MSNKKSFLEGLARFGHPKITKVIDSEISALENKFLNENGYADLAKNLAILDAIAFREPAKAVQILRQLLNRLSSDSDYEIRGQESLAITVKNKNQLIRQSLEILNKIRYLEVEQIFDVVLEFTAHQNDEIAGLAKRIIGSMVSYNYDIFEHFGYGPQLKLLSKLEKFNVSQKILYFQMYKGILQEILSPNIESTTWTYNTVNLKRANVPVCEELVTLRQQSIDLLIELYAACNTETERSEILYALQAAMHFPIAVRPTCDIISLILKNAQTVVNFYANSIGLISLKQYLLLENIEHRVYFLYRQAKGFLENKDFSDTVKQESLNLINIIDNFRDKLNSDSEFVIYKMLVGFETVLPEMWEQEPYAVISSEAPRMKYIEQYVESIDENNQIEWKKRIVEYSKTQSNDLATFQYFDNFLGILSKKKPDFILSLVDVYDVELERFLTVILDGLFKSGAIDKTYSLVNKWLDQEKHLYQITRAYYFNTNLDLSLFQKIFDKAVSLNDELALSQIPAAAFVNYLISKKSILVNMFIKAVLKLTELKSTIWVNSLWFKKELPEFIISLNAHDIETILDNLVQLDSLEYHAENILAPIADRFPRKLIDFFWKRISYYKERHDYSYTAIPYELNHLRNYLSRATDEVVDQVSSWYTNSYDFAYTGARLLKNIFPDFPLAFENKLLSLIKTHNEQKLDIVIEILKCYDGESFLFNTCKEIIKKLPIGSEKLIEVKIILKSTGVVVGEHGFAEAYERKKQALSGWLLDENENVRIFATEFVNDLDMLILSERKRADEQIELRKNMYGDKK